MIHIYRIQALQFIIIIIIMFINYIILFLDNPVSVLPKPINNIKDTGPRRSLNLEDYKKKRGLI